MKLLRPCLDCQLLTQASRCVACEARRQAQRNRARPHYLGSWRAVSRAARAAQPWCSECGATVDLTTDHVIPRSLAGGVVVLCRPCNASKGGR